MKPDNNQSGFIVRSNSGAFKVDWRRMASPDSYFATTRLVRELAGQTDWLKGRMLDIGCGTKPYRVLFSAKVSEHLGIDIPQSMHSHSEIDAYATALALPFTNASFDSVLCTEVLEHTPDPYLAISEIARVLKPGGHALVSTPFMYRIHERPYDFFRYTPYSYAQLASANGLEIASLHERGGYFTVLIDYLLKGISLCVAGLNRLVPGRNREHLLTTKPVRLAFYLLQAPLAALLKTERINADTYTLGYVVVLRKPIT